MSKKKPGRPKTNYAREHKLSIRLNNIEIEQVYRLSEHCGLSISETLRYCLRRAYVDYENGELPEFNAKF